MWHNVTIMVTTNKRIDPLEAADVMVHKLEKISENHTKVVYKYRTGSTNENGMVRFSVSKGKYIVEITHPFMKQKVMETVDISSDVKLVYDVELIFPIALTIRAVDSVTRNPLSGVEIEIYTKDGALVHYSQFNEKHTKKLNPGTYLVSLRKNGYEGVLFEVTIENQAVERVAEMRPLPDGNTQ